MKHNVLKSILLAIFVLSATSLMAQTTPSQPKVTSEFGLGAGARYNFFKVEPLSTGLSPNMTMNWSGGAALQFRLNLGRSFGFQPEISYAGAKLRISDGSGMGLYDVKVNSNIVQIPMLLSFRAAMFRFNFGPVFTLMDNTKYQLVDTDNTIKNMTIGRLYPTITYAAGISVKFAKVVMLDFRYANEFPTNSKGTFIGNKLENSFLWTLDTQKQAEAWKFRTHTQSVQARLSVVF